MDINDRIRIQRGLEEGRSLSPIARDLGERLDGIARDTGQQDEGLPREGPVEPLREEARVPRAKRMRELRDGEVRGVRARALLGGLPRVRGERLRRPGKGPLRVRGLRPHAQLRLREGPLPRGGRAAGLREAPRGVQGGHLGHAGAARIGGEAREVEARPGLEPGGDLGRARRPAPRELPHHVQVHSRRPDGPCQHRPAQESALQVQKGDQRPQGGRPRRQELLGLPGASRLRAREGGADGHGDRQEGRLQVHPSPSTSRPSSSRSWYFWKSIPAKWR